MAIAPGRTIPIFERSMNTREQELNEYRRPAVSPGVVRGTLRYDEGGAIRGCGPDVAHCANPTKTLATK